MIITKEHALALLSVRKEEVSSHRAYQVGTKTEEGPFKELEFQNLLHLARPLEYDLTYWGRALVHVLEEMVEKGLIAHPSEWDENFRWIGTEVIAMIEASMRNADIPGKYIEKELLDRGLAEEVYEEKKGKFIKLNRYAKDIYDIYQNARPRLIISKELAQYILKMPIGPAKVSMLPETERLAYELESMRLISFCVPKPTVYTLSGLGQAVQKTLKLTYLTYPTIISEDIMRTLLKLIDTGLEALTDTEIETFGGLGYIDENGELTPAGEALLECYRMWNERTYRPIKTFDLDLIDGECLLTIAKIWEKHKENPEVLPTVDGIVHFMLEKPLKEYKHLKAYFGRRLNQAVGYQKKEELKKKFADFKTIEELFKNFYEKGGEWYEKLYDVVQESLYTLESFNLIRAEELDGKKAHQITEYGEKVLQDIQERGLREIKSVAVKAITVTRTQFGSPNNEWYEEAVNEHLVGSGAPTKAGNLYADLAYNIRRLPHITRFELMVLKVIPEAGFLLDDVYAQFNETLKEEVEYALNKLESRNYIDILPNNAVVLTEPGKLMKRALAGTPTGMGNPVTPLIVRVLEALVKVGNLYVKEKKVRILPINWKKAIKISGLDKDSFEKAIAVARVANFIGKFSINEAGLLILEALEKLNEEATLGA